MSSFISQTTASAFLIYRGRVLDLLMPIDIEYVLHKDNNVSTNYYLLPKSILPISSYLYITYTISIYIVCYMYVNREMYVDTSMYYVVVHTKYRNTSDYY